MGKTSTPSHFNVPGKLGWATMEAPGFVTLLYLMYSLPRQEGVGSLPTANWVMAVLFTIHYIYRAILAPLFLNPTMSPIHITVWASALAFQLINSTCIGGWLAGYGPTTIEDWTGKAPRVEVGMMIFGVGLLANIYHDDELREIRRAARRNQKRRQEDKDNANSVNKVYMIPENGLFRAVLFPHYLCEWIEWCGFWMIGGLACMPARTFVMNEIATMLPRAVQGKQWYIERFGKEKIGSKKAVIPGII
ncbi:hypothetical protein MMC28_009424 [Mycoblastus sanguinarius]|nr:hypothetical protein [Mycoblastus sanguinarius]